MRTYQLYIGSNNATKQLELGRIKAIVGHNHQGFTVYEATGHWLGTEERTAVVIITDEQAAINATIEQLKQELHQDAIAWQAAPVMHFA